MLCHRGEYSDVSGQLASFYRQKDEVMFHSSKFLHVGLIAICIIAVTLGFTFWSWSYTTSRINSARSIGIFTSPSEGMLNPDMVTPADMAVTGILSRLASFRTSTISGTS